MSDRRWGRGAAVVALCWLSVAGLAWMIVGDVLDAAGRIEHEPHLEIIGPLVLAIIGGGGLRAHERRSAS